MKLKSVLSIFLSLFILTLAYDADAQKNRYKRRKQKSRKISQYSGSRSSSGRFQPYFYAGAAINAGNYFGDLAPATSKASTDFSFTRPGLGIFGGYKVNHSLGVRAGLNWVRVFGDDSSTDPSVNENVGRYTRNLSFRNDITEFQVGLEIFLLPNYGGPNQRLPFNIYLFLGGAVFHHEPQGKVPDFNYQTGGINSTDPIDQAGEWVNLRPLETEGVSYSNIEFSIPLALGAHIRIPGTPLNAGIEMGIRYLFTDYIDDVSSSEYADLSSFTDPVARQLADRSSIPFDSQGNSRDIPSSALDLLASPGSDGLYSASRGDVRGNPDFNDLIFMTQLKLTYVMGGVIKRRAKYR